MRRPMRPLHRRPGEPDPRSRAPGPRLFIRASTFGGLHYRSIGREYARLLQQGVPEPDEELEDSELSDAERREAIARERFRRGRRG